MPEPRLVAAAPPKPHRLWPSGRTVWVVPYAREGGRRPVLNQVFDELPPPRGERIALRLPSGEVLEAEPPGPPGRGCIADGLAPNAAGPAG